MNNQEEKWFNICAISDLGVETLVSTQDRQKAFERINPMEIRARMNNHRNMRVYVWEEAFEITYSFLEKNEKYLNEVKTKAKKIF